MEGFSSKAQYYNVCFLANPPSEARTMTPNVQSTFQAVRAAAGAPRLQLAARELQLALGQALGRGQA